MNKVKILRHPQFEMEGCDGVFNPLLPISSQQPNNIYVAYEEFFLLIGRNTSVGSIITARVDSLEEARKAATKTPNHTWVLI